MKIIRTRRYLKDLQRIGASEEDRDRLETAIASHPLAGDVIPGLGGLRKIRFAMKNRGKSRGGRAIYWVVAADLDGSVFMLTTYSKAEQSDLTSDQRMRLLRMVEELGDG